MKATVESALLVMIQRDQRTIVFFLLGWIFLGGLLLFFSYGMFPNLFLWAVFAFSVSFGAFYHVVLPLKKSSNLFNQTVRTITTLDGTLELETFGYSILGVYKLNPIRISSNINLVAKKLAKHPFFTDSFSASYNCYSLITDGSGFYVFSSKEKDEFSVILDAIPDYVVEPNTRFKVNSGVKNKRIRDNRIHMGLHYLPFLIINLYLVLGIGIGTWFEIPMALGFSAFLLLLFVLALNYYDRQMKIKMSMEYEISQDTLRVYENAILKTEVDKDSIKDTEEVALGYRVRHSKGEFIISDEIENLKQLVIQLERRTADGKH